MSQNIVTPRELLLPRKDSLAYFLDIDGKPLDTCFQKLFNRKELPKFSNLRLGIISVVKEGIRYHIGSSTGWYHIGHIKDVISSLREFMEEKEIRIVSISKTDYVDNIPWENIARELRIEFLNNSLKIIVCHGLIQYPERKEREDTIREARSSAVGGHRGITKTLKRIKHRYFWDKMKTDIEQLIEQYLLCQLKQCVRIKTKQPMVITDTPAVPLDKLAMNMVGPLPKTERQRIL